MNAETAADWRDEIFEVLQTHDIKQVYHVPDAGHSRLIEQCQRSNSIRCVPLTTEEEGIPLAAGAWLGGQRSALLMQSSGVGNTINMMGLTKTLRFPFLTLVTMRGEWGEFNSWQFPMGQGTPKVLEAMGVLVYSVDKASEVKATVDAAARAAFNGGQSVAVLLRQKLIGIKDFGKKIAKFSGCCVATVASEPRLIIRSASPVITSTRLPGCARASPSPMLTGAPMAPHSGMLSGRSPASVMSQFDEPRPAITRRLSSAPSRIFLTSGRRCRVALLIWRSSFRNL